MQPDKEITIAGLQAYVPAWGCHMKPLSKGFSLIELMIVVAIIGILAAIAIPAYQDYIARTQVTEAVELAAGGKAPLAEFYFDNGRWPADATSVMGNTTGKYVETVVLAGALGAVGEIEVVATMRSTNVSALITGGTLTMASSDGVNWTCTRGTIPPRFRPVACKP